jgi:hypothetical protein
MNEEFNHKHYNYKWTKGFLLATFVAIILLLGAVYAQESYTSNLNNNVWSNGYPVNSLDCWKGGDPNCSPGTPYVRPDGNINFSYAATELYQARAIADVLPNSGTGLMVTGFQYNWRSKNGNGWDDGRLDTLQAYVQMYSKSGQWIESQTYSLNFLHNWTDFSWSGTFSKERRGSDLGTILYGFYGKDNNYWMGPYGPEVTNVSFSLRYQPDPCVVNPLYSPQCPKFSETINSMSQLSPVVTSTINTLATASSPETTSVINLVADPTKTSVNVTTTMNEIVPSSSDFSRSIIPDRQSNVSFALSNSRLQRENAESFALTFRNSAPQQQTSITNQSSNLTNALDVINRNRQQQQGIESQTVRQAITTPQAISTSTTQNAAAASVNEAQTIALDAVEKSFTSTTTDNVQIASINIINNNQSQAIVQRSPTSGSTSVVNIAQTPQVNQQSIIVTTNDSNESQESSTSVQSFSSGVIAIQSPVVQSPSVLPEQNLSTNTVQIQSTIIQSDVISSPAQDFSQQTQPLIIAEPPKQDEIKIEIPMVAPIVVQYESPQIEMPEFKPQVIVVEKEQENKVQTIEIEIPKIVTIEIPQIEPPQQASIVEPVMAYSINLYVAPEPIKEEIEISKFIMPKFDAMNVPMPEQTNQEIQSPPQPPVFASQELAPVIEQPIALASIVPVIVPSITVTEPIAATVQNVETLQSTRQEIVLQAPVLQVESVSVASNFTTDRTNPINEIIESKQTSDFERKEPVQTTSVNRNTQNNEAAGNISIESIATQPPGFNQYASLVLRDAAFYAPKEIYRSQKTVDNARALRQLASDRLHQEMVDQQYLPR